MNLIILYFVSFALNLKRVWWRLIIGAIIGCFFLLGLIYPELSFVESLPFKIIISVAMVTTSFWPGSLSNFIKILGFFYLISFMMGGGVLAFFYVLNLQSFSDSILLINNISVPWWILLISSIILFLFIKFLWPFIQRKLLRESLLVPITIIIDKKPLDLIALIDTGNDLFDPISNYPVIIIELDVIKNIFNEEIQELLKKSSEENLQDLGELLSKSPWAPRLRIIPFESIGKNKGIMIGFRPDMVYIKYENRVLQIKNSILGVYSRILSPDGSYRALLNPVLLNE